MQKLRNLRVFYMGTLLLTVAAAVLRTLALARALNRESGYFMANQVLPTVLAIVLGIGIAYALLFPLLLRDRVPTVHAPRSTPSQIAAGLCAALSLVAFAGACTAKKSVPVPTLLWLVGIFMLLAAAVYFLTKTPLCPISTMGEAVLGSLTLIGIACLIAVTYFDIATPMNAPGKTHLHLALLSLMLYLLYELRDAVGAPLPRMRTAFGALAFFLAAAVGFSDTAAAIAGVSRSFIYLSQDFLLIGLALYIATRGVADLSATSNTERKTTKK